ncbi:MAG: pilus assembly PilX N-terminal domain-containing protein [Candidatus Omnitrophota bacterium]|jgi:hypothetical protein
MNNRGIALILSYVVIMVLTIFASAFIARTVSDTNLTARYMDSTKAFWVAEAGLNQAYYNYKNSIPQPVGPVDFPGGGTYTIDAGNLLAVKVTGIFGRTNTQRTVQASLVAVPQLFKNTLSVGGGIIFYAPGSRPASFKVGGKTRISGEFHSSGIPYRGGQYIPGTSWFEDIEEGVSVDQTTLGIPDYNNNGIENEYDDFVQMGRLIAGSYPQSEVIYLQTAGSVLLTSQSDLSRKKVVFVEGNSESWWGGGDIYVWGPSLSSGDDLTLISTHNIVYISSQQAAGSRLSTISWGQYSESTDSETREGVIYSHSYGYWTGGTSPFSTKLIKGNVMINGDVVLEGITNLELDYSDRVLRGDIPPGFKWLFSTQGDPKLMADWQEGE